MILFTKNNYSRLCSGSVMTGARDRMDSKNAEHTGMIRPFSDDEMQRAFGYHLMLDCYNCAPENLDCIDACYEFLERLVDEIGAEKQTQPYVFRTPEHFKGKEGLSGWVPIVESGISIHTLTGSRFVSLDVYSCRMFNNDKILAFTQQFFNPAEIEPNFVLRGKKYS
jgi:S-adenosylmethionine decarboxylase